MNEQCIWCFCLDGKIILDHCYLLSGHLENRSKQSHPLTLLLEVQDVISTSAYSFDPWLKHLWNESKLYILNVTEKCQSPNPIFFLSTPVQRTDSNKNYYSKISDLKTDSRLSCYSPKTLNLDIILNFAAQASTTVPAAAATMMCSWDIVKSPCKDFLNNREAVRSATFSI